MKNILFILNLLFALILNHQLLQGQNTLPASQDAAISEFLFFDKDLSKSKIKELIVHYWPERKDIISITISKISAENDWVVKYHNGIPLYKATNRKITYVFRKDNTCFRVTNLVFYSDYLGGDQYGSIYAGFSDETSMVVQSNLKEQP